MEAYLEILIACLTGGVIGIFLLQIINRRKKEKNSFYRFKEDTNDTTHETFLDFPLEQLVEEDGQADVLHLKETSSIIKAFKIRNKFYSDKEFHFPLDGGEDC